MKTFCLCLIIISSFFLSNAEDVNQKNGNGLVLNATYRGYYNFPYNIEHAETDSLYYFLVEVKLINNTGDIFKFLTATCTPIGNIVPESKDFKICVNNCMRNLNGQIELKPGQEFSIPLILAANKKNINRSIKIGWVLLTKENTAGVEHYLDLLGKWKRDYENVIWSNQIYLDMFGGRTYEIK